MTGFAVDLYGAGYDAAFPTASGPLRNAPWPRAGRRKDVEDYDRTVVADALRRPPLLVDVDPRGLRASQPSVTAPGVAFYMGVDNKSAGRLFADADKPGNQNPVVYRRVTGPSVDDVILSGHHRSTAALLRGEPLRAVVVSGGWGAPRGAARPANTSPRGSEVRERTSVPVDPVAVTAALHVGTDADALQRRMPSARGRLLIDPSVNDAIVAVRAGADVLVASWEAAAAILSILAEGDTELIERRLAYAQGRLRGDGTIPVHGGE